MIWNLKSTTLAVDCRPLVMGILNLTPDSFYDGGRFFSKDHAVERALKMAAEGADLLDVGAESTRPLAQPVSQEEECARLAPVLGELCERITIPISVDTTKAEVARRALECGAHIINDVSGLKMDPEMGPVIQSFGAGLILMHRRGLPNSMQQMTHYEDLIPDICRELGESFDIARSHHISDEQVALDPGIGFSKQADQSLEMIERFCEFQCFGRPLVVGPSRKSFIGAFTGEGSERRLSGTIAACVMAYERGARIFRVHDVGAVRAALCVAEAVLAKKEYSSKSGALQDVVSRTGEVSL